MIPEGGLAQRIPKGGPVGVLEGVPAVIREGVPAWIPEGEATPRARASGQTKGNGGVLVFRDRVSEKHNVYRHNTTNER